MRDGVVATVLVPPTASGKRRTAHRQWVAARSLLTQSRGGSLAERTRNTLWTEGAGLLAKKTKTQHTGPRFDRLTASQGRRGCVHTGCGGCCRTVLSCRIPRGAWRYQRSNRPWFGGVGATHERARVSPEMQQLLQQPPAPAATKQDPPICCRGAFVCGALVGVLASLGGVAIALWQLGEFGATPQTPGPAGNASLLGCTLASDVQIMLVQGNTWESDGGNQFLNAQQDCMKKQPIEGTAASVGACMVKSTNISSECGLLWGMQAVCMRDKCLAECVATKLPHPPKSAKVNCANCVCKHCRRQQLTEMKLPCTLLPAEADPDQGCHDCPGHTVHWPPPHPNG